MVTVSLAMLALMGLTIGAFAAASGDLGLADHDNRSKRAYEAAEAGLHDYLFHLNENSSYWTLCDQVPGPAQVNQPWNGVGADPRRWRNLPGATGQYAIEVLPAPGKTTCDTANAQGSMIDSQGTFRIRSTGRVNGATSGLAAKRSIVATFRRRGFLDFLYYTDYETTDPTWYEVDTRGRATQVNPASNGGSTQPDLLTWASANCPTYYRDGRGNKRWYDAGNNGQNDGQIFWFDNTWHYWPNFTDRSQFNLCTEIQFAPGDVIRGPLHTNDELLVCGSPTFGRNAQDRVEVSAPNRNGFSGWRGSGACSGNNPSFVGTFTTNSPILAMPPTNTKLKKLTSPAYTFTGTTTIVLSGNNLVVTNAAAGMNNTTLAFPSNGLIYVQSGSCGIGYKPLDPYNVPAGCGDVWVKGNYSQDLTIAVEKDIIVNDDVTRSADKMLGLIANNFIRVYHPITGLTLSQSGVTCTNDAARSIGSTQIDAAILSLNHSFTVDHYFCGNPLGTLTVNGAIAQKFRGPVGRGGNSVTNGYVKNYNYDDRLAFRSPPHFLDPVQSAWKIIRQTEQTPPR